MNNTYNRILNLVVNNRTDEGKVSDFVQKVGDKVKAARARWNKAQGKAEDTVTGRGSFDKDPNAPFGRNNKGEPRKGVDNGRQPQHN